VRIRAARLERGRPAVTQITIYSRPGCHLCDEMKSLVTRVGRSIPFALQEIDISGDSELERQYGEEIPVLLVDGWKIAKYRITEDQLRRALASRQSGCSL
jgi:glutaredoxin